MTCHQLAYECLRNVEGSTEADIQVLADNLGHCIKEMQIDIGLRRARQEPNLSSVLFNRYMARAAKVSKL